MNNLSRPSLERERGSWTSWPDYIGMATIRGAASI